MRTNNSYATSLDLRALTILESCLCLLLVARAVDVAVVCALRDGRDIAKHMRDLFETPAFRLGISEVDDHSANTICETEASPARNVAARVRACYQGLDWG